MAHDQTETVCCPFWSNFAQKCRISSDGLFIPLDDHIDIYCTSQDYSLCLQFSMNNDVPEIIDDVAELENRRNFPRVEAQYRVTLVKITETGRLAKHFSLHATTVDISKGGMQLATNEQLVDDTRIAFSFIDNLPKEMQSGIAKIKWSKKNETTGAYHAGLAFEDLPSKAIGAYLEDGRSR
ncbi:MAG: PilZ domain-containing protein [Desulfobulbaceae bacterium]|nr:PilZ domain-containing protein [Desulfobulbaceae bacterium]